MDIANDECRRIRWNLGRNYEAVCKTNIIYPEGQHTVIKPVHDNSGVHTPSFVPSKSRTSVDSMDIKVSRVVGSAKKIAK